VIYLQFDFIQNKELGYDKDHILVVRTRSKEVRKNIEPIKQALIEQTKIKLITTSNSLPSDIGSSTLARLKEDGVDEDNIDIYRNDVDYDYVETFGLKLVAGRNFSPEIESDKDKVIINESAAYAFGWTPEEAVGNQFYRVGQKYLEVIGVVKDFHMFAMHLKIQPLMISLRNEYFNYASFKIEPNDLPNTIALIEENVQKYSQYPFEYQFMDDEFDRLYKADIKLGKIFGMFTFLSIIIASLGLFGLAAYITKQRTKEIGIRKVLGASVQRIVTLVIKDFLIMVLVGFVLAVPIAWGIMSIWLEEYAYRISMEWWMFALAGVIATIVSLVTISSQSIKASMSNPVDSLRSE
jgi:putative ABC transport system permease protein